MSPCLIYIVVYADTDTLTKLCGDTCLLCPDMSSVNGFVL